MGRGIPLPGIDRLPPGPRRDLAAALHELYRAAGMPSLRRIANAVRGDDDLRDTVSHEKVAEMLRGEGLPGWFKLEAVVRVLATWSTPRRDPDVQAERLQQLWYAAREGHPSGAGEPTAPVARPEPVVPVWPAPADTDARLFAEANEALPGAEMRVGEARGRVAGARVAADEARRALAAAQSALDVADAGLRSANQRVTDASDQLGRFVSASYKGGGIATLNVVFEAHSPTELATRLGYLERVVDNQRKALDAVMIARLDAKLASNAAVVARRLADEAQQATERALAAARDEQAAAERAAADVTALAAQRKEALDVAAEEKTESLARYERMKEESARVEAKLREWEARQQQQQQQQGRPAPAPGPVLRPGARLLMPVRGWKSSDFGMRFDPFYGVWQLHAGVDIAADGGQPIYAAADGKVVQAGWNGGYGNYTCLYHGQHQGRGLATCYAHQSRILVNEDQRVRRGDVIGRVGTTGASTGNHLHFEVRIGGGPVEPLNWLPACLC